jgi:hypothetical protein
MCPNLIIFVPNLTQIIRHNLKASNKIYDVFEMIIDKELYIYKEDDFFYEFILIIKIIFII